MTSSNNDDPSLGFDHHHHHQINREIERGNLFETLFSLSSMADIDVEYHKSINGPSDAELFFKTKHLQIAELSSRLIEIIGSQNNIRESHTSSTEPPPPPPTTTTTHNNIISTIISSPDQAVVQIDREIVSLLESLHTLSSAPGIALIGEPNRNRNFVPFDMKHSGIVNLCEILMRLERRRKETAYDLINNNDTQTTRRRTDDDDNLIINHRLDNISLHAVLVGIDDLKHRMLQSLNSRTPMTVANNGRLVVNHPRERYWRQLEYANYYTQVLSLERRREALIRDSQTRGIRIRYHNTVPRVPTTILDNVNGIAKYLPDILAQNDRDRADALEKFHNISDRWKIDLCSRRLLRFERTRDALIFGDSPGEANTAYLLHLATKTSSSLTRNVEEEGLRRNPITEGTGDCICAVCLEYMKAGEDTRAMGCSHTFHFRCISEWMKRKHTCPICRYIMNEQWKTTPTN